MENIIFCQYSVVILKLKKLNKAIVFLKFEESI